MKKPTALVVGSGAGGATIAKELQGSFQVTILEAGKAFKPFGVNVEFLEKFKRTGLFFNEREISLLFPSMKIQKTSDGMVMVWSKGLGGTTPLSAGNALRCDTSLRNLGIDLDSEFSELYQEIPITYDHRERWRASTEQLFLASETAGFYPQQLPKMGNYSRCTRCGQCVLGCKYKAKWDSNIFVEEALAAGAQLISGCTVDQIIFSNNEVVGVKTRQGLRAYTYSADVIILAAGGLGTPQLLERSGIPCNMSLFVDPVLCVAAHSEKAFQNREISMPFVIEEERFIVAPYFDFLSNFFNKSWIHPASDTVSLMIKLADSSCGSVNSQGCISKPLSTFDKQGLGQGVELCQKILSEFGIPAKKTFLGTLNAGHPGGMLALTKEDAETLHSPRLPRNLYVSDASLFPQALGKPPIFTIMALAKKIASRIKTSI